MKKRWLLLAAFLLLNLVSCSEDDNPVAPPEQFRINPNKDRLYLFNGSSNPGTLSVLQDSTITNSFTTLGKYPNDIKYHNGLLYVLNSATNNIKVIDEITSQPIASLEMAKEGSNPWQMAFANGKIYVTSSKGSGVEVWSQAERKYLRTIIIPDLVPEAGTSAIHVQGNKIFVNRANWVSDANWHVTYGTEKMFVLDAVADTIMTSFTSGINCAGMLLDKEGELNVLFTGDRENIGGYVKTFDTNSYLVKDSIYLGSQPAVFVMAADGEVFVSVSGSNPDWTSFGGMMRYNSVNNQVINNANNLFYSNSNSGIMGIYISDDKKIYLPLFNENKLVILNSTGTVMKTLVTGNGPQGLCYVKTTN